MFCLRLSIHVWPDKATSAITMFDKLNINMLELNFMFASIARHVPNVLRA